jgi:hypothetical protein
MDGGNPVGANGLRCPARPDRKLLDAHASSLRDLEKTLADMPATGGTTVMAPADCEGTPAFDADATGPDTLPDLSTASLPGFDRTATWPGGGTAPIAELRG